MNKIYADAGTSWCKILEIMENDSDSSQVSFFDELESYQIAENGNLYADNEGKIYKGKTFIIPTKEFSAINLPLAGATGHMSKQKLSGDSVYFNELVALAYGAKKRVNDLTKATIIDIGSRDLKWVKFEKNKFKDLDWNGSCGSATGATVEMLTRFYGVDPQKLPPSKEKIPVICGVFAMEKIMDEIASGNPPEEAVAKYIHGIAYNSWIFAGKPEKAYLSGGFCLNKCFIESLSFYCEVIPLGRFVLTEGLF